MMNSHAVLESHPLFGQFERAYTYYWNDSNMSSSNNKLYQRKYSVAALKEVKLYTNDYKLVTETSTSSIFFNPDPMRIKLLVKQNGYICHLDAKNLLETYHTICEARASLIGLKKFHEYADTPLSLYASAIQSELQFFGGVIKESIDLKNQQQTDKDETEYHVVQEPKNPYMEGLSDKDKASIRKGLGTLAITWPATKYCKPGELFADSPIKAAAKVAKSHVKYEYTMRGDQEVGG